MKGLVLSPDENEANVVSQNHTNRRTVVYLSARVSYRRKRSDCSLKRVIVWKVLFVSVPIASMKFTSDKNLYQQEIIATLKSCSAGMNKL